MKFNKNLSFIFCGYLAVLLLFITSGVAFAEDAPINIEANHMTSTEKSNSVIFTGDVDAKQADVRIRSDKMTVYYTPKESGTKKKTKGKEGATQQVEKMVCVGNVEITRGEWLGTSKKMVYLSKERQVILTGNAKAWQGQNVVSGEKIIYFLDEGRSEVVGERTSTTIGENSGKKKPSRVNMTILQK
ncbi:MAG: lipopolysaccharide export system protein LptA [Desulforhopalus sp.]|jgi:lipopolysaccharide export system protein LptA